MRPYPSRWGASMNWRWWHRRRTMRKSLSLAGRRTLPIYIKWQSNESVDQFIWLRSFVSAHGSTELYADRRMKITKFASAVLSKIWKCSFLNTHEVSCWDCSVLMIFLGCYMGAVHEKWLPILLESSRSSSTLSFVMSLLTMICNKFNCPSMANVWVALETLKAYREVLARVEAHFINSTVTNRSNCRAMFHLSVNDNHIYTKQLGVIQWEKVNNEYSG